MATLRYRGLETTTFHDVTVYVPIENEPPRAVTARVGELSPDQVFTVPDECVEPFLRRADVELVEDLEDAPPTDAAPKFRVKAKGTAAAADAAK